MIDANQQICPPFRIECNFYNQGNFLQGFADAVSFVEKNASLEDAPGLLRYLKKSRSMAKNHFTEEVEYPGAEILGLNPESRFVAIDAWLTKLVTRDVEVKRVKVDVTCMIRCCGGDCITRGEAKGTDPFVMPPEMLEERKKMFKGMNREYRKYDDVQ